MNKLLPVGIRSVYFRIGGWRDTRMFLVGGPGAAAPSGSGPGQPSGKYTLAQLEDTAFIAQLKPLEKEALRTQFEAELMDELRFLQAKMLSKLYDLCQHPEIVGEVVRDELDKIGVLTWCQIQRLSNREVSRLAAEGSLASKVKEFYRGIIETAKRSADPGDLQNILLQGEKVEINRNSMIRINKALENLGGNLFLYVFSLSFHRQIDSLFPFSFILGRIENDQMTEYGRVVSIGEEIVIGPANDFNAITGSAKTILLRLNAHGGILDTDRERWNNFEKRLFGQIELRAGPDVAKRVRQIEREQLMQHEIGHEEEKKMLREQFGINSDEFGGRVIGTIQPAVAEVLAEMVGSGRLGQIVFELAERDTEEATLRYHVLLFEFAERFRASAQGPRDVSQFPGHLFYHFMLSGLNSDLSVNFDLLRANYDGLISGLFNYSFRIFELVQKHPEAEEDFAKHPAQFLEMQMTILTDLLKKTYFPVIGMSRPDEYLQKINEMETRLSAEDQKETGKGEALIREGKPLDALDEILRGKGKDDQGLLARAREALINKAREYGYVDAQSALRFMLGIAERRKLDRAAAFLKTELGEG